jgi:hypothetical protein
MSLPEGVTPGSAREMPRRVGRSMREAHRMATEMPGIDAELVARRLSPLAKVADGMKTVRKAILANMVRADSGRLYPVDEKEWTVQ